MLTRTEFPQQDTWVKEKEREWREWREIMEKGRERTGGRERGVLNE